MTSPSAYPPPAPMLVPLFFVKQR
ncbi:MAG: hypothetical protein JWQ45_3501, partial [Blastococcus sp.]|nr:hypothetical protein [Blastococcus sp.]